MSLFGRQRRALGDTPQELVPSRTIAGPIAQITPDSALRHSAVWACLRLRADIISTLPVEVYRQMGELQVSVPKPAWLDQPSPGVDITEFLYSSQVDLDRYGNTFGVITARDGYGLPARIELVPAGDVRIKATGSQVTEYRFGKQVYDPRDVWHERQFTVAGFPMGLSPIAYASWTVGTYEAAQKFSLDWFVSGAFPSGVLKNTEYGGLDPKVVAEAKSRFKVSTENRDIFVTGKDWEWTPAASENVANGFLEAMQAGIHDVCRFLGVPGDAIDAEHHGKSITYANVTQRNLQLLIHNLGPVIIRRERAITRALPAARLARLNSDALLRMDPQTRIETILRQVVDKVITDDEGRAELNRAPLTAAQRAQMQAAALPAPMPTTIQEMPANG